jgi:hypothetical protein
MNIWFIISSRMNCMGFDKFFKPNMRRLIKFSEFCIWLNVEQTSISPIGIVKG